MLKYAVIVAGGLGSRLDINTPKQFLLLNKKPILMHTIGAFFGADKATNIVVVMHKDFIAHWQGLCIDYGFEVGHSVVEGGKERFDSVKNGLNFIDQQTLFLERSGLVVAVHDAARPLVSKRLIDVCFDGALACGAVVPVVGLKESIRKMGVDGESQAVNRVNFCMVQTPQTFRFEVLKASYSVDFDPLFTDDASVVEAAGFGVRVVEGSESNFKITSPIDLKLAGLLCLGGGGHGFEG